MTYTLTYSSVAIKDLKRVPADLLNFVEGHLLRLASSPVRLSRPGAFPYPENCQLYQFQARRFSRTYAFTILFRYHPDEQTLWIVGIGHGELAAPWEAPG
jgi:hypothetical protein